MSTAGISWWDKGWQRCHLHVAIIWKFWDPQSPGAQKTCPGLYRDYFTGLSRYNPDLRKTKKRLISTEVQTVSRN